MTRWLMCLTMTVLLSLIAGRALALRAETAPPSMGDDPWCPAYQPSVHSCTAQTCLTTVGQATPAQKGNCVAGTHCAWQYTIPVKTTNCYAGLDEVEFRGERVGIQPPKDIVFTGSISAPCEYAANKIIRFYKNNQLVGTCTVSFPCGYCPDP